MSTHTYRSMASVALSKNRKVTIWRNETSLSKNYKNGDLFGASVLNSELPASALADHLMRLDRVVAVEVIDGDGHGVHIHK